MGNSQSSTETECFSKWHQDITVSNSHQTARNWHDWCYNRTCYGSIQVSTDNDLILRWVIEIVDVNGYVCIGIDSSQQMDTWFYQNKNQPNYGYECTGKMYECGQETDISTQKYGAGDWITMVLHTTSGILEFYKKGKPCNHFFKIKKDTKLKYRLAVSLKRAEVKIIDYSQRNDELQKKYREIIKQNEELRQKLEERDLEREEEKKEEEDVAIYQDVVYGNKGLMVSQQNIEISDIERSIRVQMKQFRDNYNETTLKTIRNEKGQDLVSKESKLNRDVKLYENNAQIIQKSLDEFSECIENTKIMINELSSSDERDYKKWDVNTIIIWIGTLENGRYVKYLDKLKNGFMKSQILNGEYLPDLDVATLSVVPFEIDSFPDKRDLVAQFKALKTNNTEIEGASGTAYY